MVRKLHAVYDPLLAAAMRRPLIVAVLVAIGVAAAVGAFHRIGETFMPVMDEGTPIISLRKFPTISIAEAAQTDLRIEQELMSRDSGDQTHHGARRLGRAWHRSRLASTRPTCI